MYKLLVIILLLWYGPFVKAQGNNFKSTSYSVNEGLPQSSIYGINQDTNGFVWIGTAGGLCRFDGYQMKVYKQSNVDKKAITSYKEFRFYNDSSGRMWIVSFNGISLYNSLTDNFTNVFVYSPKNVVIAGNHFYGEDKDFIWIGLCSYGIVKVDKHTLKVYDTPLTKTSQRPSNKVAYKGFLDKSKLWIVDNNESANPIFSIYNILLKKADTLNIPLTDIINLNDAEALGLTKNATVLINKKTLAYRITPMLEKEKDLNVVSMHKQLATEVILCSATQGLMYVNPQTGKIVRHISYTNIDNKKTPLYASCVFVDRSGNTWVGTSTDGVYKISFPFQKFSGYSSEIIDNNNAFGIYADSADIYIGMFKAGLTKFSRQNGFTKKIVENSTISKALNNAYTISSWDNDKLIFIATSAENKQHSVPFIYTKATGKVEIMNKEVQKVFAENWGRGNLRHFLFKDANKNFITSIGEYLVSISPCSGNNFCPKILNRFAGEALTCGLTDNDGSLWIGSFKGLFHQTNKGWKKVNLPKNKEVKSIAQDKDGNIWMGSNDDITVLNKDYKVIQTYTEENTLVNGHVYAMLKDDDGNMWFSHNKGLSVYYWKEKKFKHFDKEDGLQSSEFNVGACFKTGDGELFFGGINGVTGFYPRQILQNTNTPQVKITGIKLFDEPYKMDSAYWNIHSLELPYTDNSLSFEFVLPEFTNQQKNQYAYLMEGVDKNWITSGDKRFARYAGLNPGKYTFKVKACNNDGVWNEVPTSISIYIVPPFWQRLWFIVLAGLLAVSLIAFVVIFIQKQQFKKKMHAIEVQYKVQLERERISRDLHDNVGTQLSLISKSIQGMMNDSIAISEEDKKKKLQSTGQSSIEVIGALRETIWALNKEEVSLQEFFDKLKSFAQKQTALSPETAVEFKEAAGNEQVLLGPAEALHLFRICQEAITNALKYANASSLKIEIKTSQQKYIVVIEDNGNGFDKKNINTTLHYGLENMKHRAREIACSLTIDAKKNEGTTITITKE